MAIVLDVRFCPIADIAADGLIPRKDSRFLLAICVGERVYRIIDAA